MNPTTDVFEKRVAALEGGVAALAFASGQAAETAAIQNIASAGDEIVSTTSLYGGTYNLFAYTLPKQGITVKFAAPTPEAVHAAITDKTKAVYSETIGNPDLLTLDIEGVAEVAHERRHSADHRQHHAEPVSGQPDQVRRRHRRSLGHQVHRRSWHVDRRHRGRWRQVRLEGIGQVPRVHRAGSELPRLVYSESSRRRTSAPTSPTSSSSRVQILRDIGAAISPFNSFLFIQGLETLPLRMERHSQNALAVARFLNKHPKVTWVNYPGLATHPAYAGPQIPQAWILGAMLGFGVKAGLEAGRSSSSR